MDLAKRPAASSAPATAAENPPAKKARPVNDPSDGHPGTAATAVDEGLSRSPTAAANCSSPSLSLPAGPLDSAGPGAVVQTKGVATATRTSGGHGGQGASTQASKDVDSQKTWQHAAHLALQEPSANEQLDQASSLEGEASTQVFLQVPKALADCQTAEGLLSQSGPTKNGQAPLASAPGGSAQSKSDVSLSATASSQQLEQEPIPQQKEPQQQQQQQIEPSAVTAAHTGKSPKPGQLALQESKQPLMSARGSIPAAKPPTVPTGVPKVVSNPREAQIVFMGTGSAEPQKYRGPSAIHVRLESGLSVLLDCGEGTWGQFVRRYGADSATQQVASLACVWISHKHSDHLLGLPGILSARPPSCPPLLVVGPPAARAWLQELGGEQVLRYRFLLNLAFNKPCRESQWLFRTTGFWQFQSVPVEHCHHAYGVVMRHGQGPKQWSLVYSGDCRPSPDLIQAGQGCSLLIHEATFEATLQADAHSKKHSTVDEAMQVATAMNADRVILTHFSQRYPRLPVGLPVEGKPNYGYHLVAYDGMVVPLSMLRDMPNLMPLLTAALETDEDRLKAAERREQHARPELRLPPAIC
ncbi:hypothetical protein WJX74_008798 [Apatococcus lobatus]|uniref:ribonuclease Z n=1 Tax=Apatococcus lobatus TaxID=904363 RepID=A0AAW1QM62_9CHLO